MKMLCTDGTRSKCFLVSVMDNKQTIEVSCRVLDLKQQNIFGHILLQFYAPEQRDTAKDVLLFLVRHSGTHSHCLFV